MKKLQPILFLTATLSLTSATVTEAATTSTVSNWLALTITNPTPSAEALFSRSVAAVGSDRVLIGAPGNDTGETDAGAAYLVSTSGALITTYTNPTPEFSDWFGASVAAVGTDRVVIGAYLNNTGARLAGAAYLFSTNGALLTTFTKPTPADGDYFGISVAGVGSDRVLIGAYGDDTGAGNAGAAYLFSTNGALLTTFTNPMPAGGGQNFGYSVAAVGASRVLIGAHRDYTSAPDAGAAFLFNTDGTLLTTFTNPAPSPSDFFGSSVAGVGADRVLIGAYAKDIGAFDAGAAYLFSVNGALLTTFTNPTPAAGDFFGWSVATMGTDRVLIGAYHDDTGASRAGAAYLFSTNGALLSTFTNPAPAASDLFGWSVTGVGTDRLLIGAPYDDRGAVNTGTAYLFGLQSSNSDGPSLSAIRSSHLSTVTVSWPSSAEGWLLEHTNALPSLPLASWPSVSPPYQTNEGTISVTFTNQPAAGNQFFRLHKP